MGAAVSIGKVRSRVAKEMSFCTSLRILGGCSQTLRIPGAYARISAARSLPIFQPTSLSRSPRNIFTATRCLSSRPISNDAPSVSHSFSSESIPSLTSGTEKKELPPLSPPSVSNWLLGSAALVFGIIVVGGITRLTESGLSIVEWRPVSGVLPPLSEAAWELEFEKYKTSPEFKM
jgi:heme a synthase